MKISVSAKLRPKDYKIGFRNIAQVVLYDVELSGQISDGHWENSTPHRHWEKPSAATPFVAKQPDQFGPNFIPERSYNFASSTLLDVVGDRMVFAVKTIMAFPKMPYDAIRDANYFYENCVDANGSLDPKASIKSIKSFLVGSGGGYFKKKLSGCAKYLGAKDVAGVVAAFIRIDAEPFSMAHLKKELSDMNKIFSGRAGKMPDAPSPVGVRASPIKGSDKYQWYTFTGSTPVAVTRRGQQTQIHKGSVFGIRPSSSGKDVRMIFRDAETIVYTITPEQHSALVKTSKAES